MNVPSTQALSRNTFQFAACCAIFAGGENFSPSSSGGFAPGGLTSPSVAAGASSPPIVVWMLPSAIPTAFASGRGCGPDRKVRILPTPIREMPSAAGLI
jgi:hypothetical protein